MYQPLRLTQPPTLSGKGISTGQGTLAVLCAGKLTIGLALHQPSITGCHISTYRLNGLRKGDEHPLYTPARCIALYFYHST